MTDDNDEKMTVTWAGVGGDMTDVNDDKDHDNDDEKIYLNRCAAVSTFHLEKEKQTFHFQPTGHDCQWKNMPLKKLRRNYIFLENVFASKVAQA